MARTIDEKIVVLKFDNSNFERNTKETMSTLDKLKAKLNFGDSSKSLNKLGESAKKVDMRSLSNSVDEVGHRFSAMEVIGVTALANITNSAVNAGKALLSAITIDPLKSGWNKMGDMMGNVQTLVNATGKSTEEIEDYLERLMWYSDETSYGFTDMTAALASMASAGGDIDKLIPTIMGIANATAYAGKGAAEFSRVIYNLNQSYGAGYLQNRDWMSVEMAGAASKQLKEVLIQAGEELGTIQKKGSITIANFRDSLQDKWATTDVMELAFSRFSGLTMLINEAYNNEGYWLNKFDKDGKPIWQDYTTAAKAIEDFMEGASNSMDDVGKGYDKLAIKAFKSAQEAKKFSEVIEATADAVGSAWLSVFKSIFGNYDEQVKLWTGLSNYLYDIFVTPIYNMQEKIENALDFSGFQDVFDKVMNSKLIQGLLKIQEGISGIDNVTQKTSKSLKEYQDIVYKVWRGDYGNMYPRWNALDKMGYDSRVVQRLVDRTEEIAGYGKGYTVIDKLTEEDVIKYEKKYGITVENTNDAIEDQIDKTEDLNDALESLTDQQLTDMGLKKDEIELYRQLERGASKYRDTIYQLTGRTGIPALMDIMTTMKGRDLLFGAPKIDDSKKNTLGLSFEEVKYDENGEEIYQTIGAFTALLRTFKNVLIMVKDAWAEVFHFDSVDLYMTILKFQQFANHIYDMTRSVQGMKNLKDTFKGLFAILKLIVNVVHAPLKIAWIIFKTVLETCGMTVLEFTGALGNLLSKFVDFVVENEFIIKGITQLAKVISEVVISVYQWIQSQISLNGALEKVSKGFKKFYDKFKTWLSGMKGKSIDEIIDYIWNSLVRAYNRVKNFLTDKIKNLPSTLLGALKSVKESISNWFNGLGDAKSSGKLGSYIIKGLINGLKGGAKGVYQAIKSIAIGLIDTFKTMFGIHSPSKLFITLGGFLIAGLAIGIKDAGGDVFTAITNIGNGILERIKSVFTWIADLFGSSGQALLRVIKQIDLNTIITGFIAIGGVLAIYKFAKALGVLAQGLSNLIDLAGATAKVVSKFAGVLVGVKYRLIGAAFHDLARGILEVAIAVLLLSKVKSGKMWEIFGFMTAILAVFGLFMTWMSALSKAPTDIKEAVGMGKMIGAILAVSVGFLLIAIAFKKLSDIHLSTDGAFVITSILITFITSLALLTKFQNDVSKIGTMLLGLGVAFYLISRAVNILANINPDGVGRATHFIFVIGILIAGLMAATQLLGRKYAVIEKLGTMMIKVGVAFYLIARAVKIIGAMPQEEFQRGMAGIFAVFGIIVVIGILAGVAQKLLNESKLIEKLGKTFLEIGGAFILIALAIGILGRMKTETLTQGLIAVGVLLLEIVGFAWLLKKAGVKDIAKMGGTMAGVALAILGIAVALLILSLIDPGKLALSLIVLAVVFGGLAVVANYMKGLKLVSWKAITALGGVILMIAAALIALSFIDWKKLIAPVIGIGIILYLLEGVIDKLSKIQSSKSFVKNAAIMMAFIVAIGAVLTGLSFLPNPLAALSGAAAISLLMIVVTEISEKINKMRLGKTMISKLAIMVGFMAAVAIVVRCIKDIDATTAIGGAIAISILMAACAGILVILDKISKGISIKDILLGVLGLVAVLGAAWIAIQVLKSMNGIQNVEQNVAALVTFMIGMSLVLIMTALVGTLYTVTAGIAATGLLGLAVLLVICVGVIDILQAMNNVKNAEKNANILTTFLGKLAAILLQIGIIAPLALMAVVAVGALLTLITVFGVIITAFGALASKFPDLQKFVDVGIELFVKLAEGIGRILGAFINGLLGSIMEILPMIGRKLSEFMINAMPFIMGCKLINKQTLASVGILVASILGLTVASLIEGIARFLPFSRSFADMGSDLSDFMRNAMPFIDGIRAMDPVAVECVDNLATAILKLTAANLLNSLSAFFGSSISLAQFGSEIAPLGTGMRQFIENIGVFGDNELNTTKIACDAIAALADAGSQMRRTGGLAQIFAGTQEDLGAFGMRLPLVAAGIKGFINTLTDNGATKFGDQQLKTVEAGANVVKTLAEAASKVPDTGFSLKSLVSGSPGDLEEFCNKFPMMAKAIRTFVNTLNGEDSVWMQDGPGFFEGHFEKIPATAETAFKISDDISKVLGDLGKFIEAMAKLGEVDEDELEEVTEFVSEKLPPVGRSIKAFIKALTEDENWNGIVGGLATFANNVAEVPSEDDEEKVAEKAKNIVTLATELIKSLAGFKGMDHNDLDDFYDFSKDLPEVGAYLNAFIDALINGMTIDKKKVGKAIDSSNPENIKTLVEAAGALITSLNGIGTINYDAIKDKMPQFKTDLSGFAENIKTFVTSLADLSKDDINEAKEKMDLIKQLSDDLENSLKSEQTQISNKLITTMKSAYELISKDKGLIQTVQNQAGEILNKFKEGFDGKDKNGTTYKESIKTKLIAIANDVILGLGGSKSSNGTDNTTAGKAKQIGEAILQGLLNGLSNDNTNKLISTKAYDIGKSVIDQMKSGSGVGSPSKYAREAGNYIIEGLIIGIEEYSSRVYDLSYQTGQMAVDGLNEAVAMASSLMETNDTLNPVITPVLDLSNIQTGISNMNSMFNNSQVGVLSNLRTIDSEMNSRNQNGHNYEVVSAINKLGKSLDDNPRNVYNVNGITYDGSSSVNDAVQQLINAIEIERRV